MTARGAIAPYALTERVPYGRDIGSLGNGADGPGLGQFGSVKSLTTAMCCMLAAPLSPCWTGMTSASGV